MGAKFSKGKINEADDGSRTVELEVAIENKLMLYSKEYVLSVVMYWLLFQDASQREYLKGYFIKGIEKVDPQEEISFSTRVRIHNGKSTPPSNAESRYGPPPYHAERR